NIVPSSSIVDPDATVRSRFHARVRGRPVTESFDEPLGVVAGDELGDDAPRLGEALEAMEIEALLLEGAHKALDHAVALGLPDVRWGDRHPQPLHLVDPGIGDVLRTPVATDPQPARDVLREAAGLRHH